MHVTAEVPNGTRITYSCSNSVWAIAKFLFMNHQFATLTKWHSCFGELKMMTRSGYVTPLSCRTPWMAGEPTQWPTSFSPLSRNADVDKRSWFGSQRTSSLTSYCPPCRVDGTDLLWGALPVMMLPSQLLALDLVERRRHKLDHASWPSALLHPPLRPRSLRVVVCHVQIVTLSTNDWELN